MSKPRSISIKVEHKQSGKWYWMEKRLTWGKFYYSFDGGDSWHATRKAAFEAAEDAGNLNEVKMANPKKARKTKKAPSAKLTGQAKKDALSNAAASIVRAWDKTGTAGKPTQAFVKKHFRPGSGVAFAPLYRMVVRYGSSVTPKKRNSKTIIKAKRVTILNLKKNPEPKRGQQVYTLASFKAMPGMTAVYVGKEGSKYLLSTGAKTVKANRKDFRLSFAEAAGNTLMKKRTPRKPNITSAQDLQLAGSADPSTRDGVKGWTVAKKFYPGSATPKTVALNKSKTAFLDLKYGDVWKRKAKGNPKGRPVGKGTQALRAKLVKALDAAQDSGRVTDAQADRLFELILDGWPMVEDNSRRQQQARKRAVEAFRRQGVLRKERKENIAQGFYDGSGIFHPIRASADYDGKTAGETGGKPRHTRSKKKKAASRKASQTARDRAAKRAASKTKIRLASRALQRSVPLKKQRHRNVAQGFYDGNGVFHPIRASHDYDGKTAGETGGKPRRTRSKKRAASARKASSTARSRAATKQRKATTSRLASRSLQRSVPLKKARRSNPRFPAPWTWRVRKGRYGIDAEWSGEGFINDPYERTYPHVFSLLEDTEDKFGKRISAQMVKAAEESQGEWVGKSRKAKRRNPNADTKAAYESFQGKPSTKSTSLNFPNGTPANVYKLGTLHSITLQSGAVVKPAGKTVWLCADTKGKLHLGTSGERLVNAPKGALGKVKEIEYITTKPHLGDSRPTRYYHELGEETGQKPTLYSDGNGGLVFKGGATYVRSDGIHN